MGQANPFTPKPFAQVVDSPMIADLVGDRRILFAGALMCQQTSSSVPRNRETSQASNVFAAHV
jgi:hypothetical protein